MRNLNECRAEIFRRSEKRIKERRKKRRFVLMWCVSLCLLIAIVPHLLLKTPSDVEKKDGYAKSEGQKGWDKSAGTVGDYDSVPIPNLGGDQMGTVDSFSFSLTWGCYGISSYDSTTGKLVKTTDATNPEAYITTYQLTEEQKKQIFELVKDLEVTTYPDTYDPHRDGLTSSPSMTLILSVKTDTFQKTITAQDIALTYESENWRGQKFLDVCKGIRDILIQTEEWKALPEYEFFYD